MATTYSSFLSALAGTTVTGVTRQFTLSQSPPTTLDTADLPASFVIPGGSENAAPVAFSGQMGRTFRGTLVIIIQPDGQDTAPANYAVAVSLMDALHTGLQSSMTMYDMTPTWAIREGHRGDYWAVWAEVTLQE